MVAVVDEGGSPVAGVAVSGSFSGGWNGTDGGTTDGLGEVVLTTPTIKNLGFVAFCVDSATKAGWSWNVAGSTVCGDSDGGGAAFGSVSGSVTDVATGSGISNAAVSADTGQSTTTDAFGDYALAGVPTGNRTITATASGYDSQNALASVSEGFDTIVDFALDETPAGGSGAIRGTIYSTTGSKVADVGA